MEEVQHRPSLSENVLCEKARVEIGKADGLFRRVILTQDWLGERQNIRVQMVAAEVAHESS